MTIGVSEAREKLSGVIDASRTEAIILGRYGRPAAVLIRPDRYEQLLDAAEEAEDIEAFVAATAEEGDNICWDQVKADLGWPMASRATAIVPAAAATWSMASDHTPTEWALSARATKAPTRTRLAASTTQRRRFHSLRRGRSQLVSVWWASLAP